MKWMFLDESGELGFNPAGSKRFVAALICVGPVKPFNRFIKRWSAKLISAGWPKNREIKAVDLYRAHLDRDIPDTFPWKKDTRPIIGELLGGIASRVDEIRLITIEKSKLDSVRLGAAPYGVLYNYFTSWLIVPAAKTASAVHLVVDQRNKESHNLLHFDGYVETSIWAARPNGTMPLKLEIEHKFSHEVYGLRAVDFVSWATFRYRERGDDTFFRFLQPKIKQDILWPK